RLANWLYGVASRVAHKAKLSTSRRDAHERSAARSTFVAPVTVGPDGAELRAVIDEEMVALPEKYRAPLVLCYLEGLTNEDAGRAAGRRAGILSLPPARGWAPPSPTLGPPRACMPGPLAGVPPGPDRTRLRWRSAGGVGRGHGEPRERGAAADDGLGAISRTVGAFARGAPAGLRGGGMGRLVGGSPDRQCARAWPAVQRVRRACRQLSRRSVVPTRPARHPSLGVSPPGTDVC